MTGRTRGPLRAGCPWSASSAIQNGQLDGYEARVFLVMIGTNNCWGNKVDAADVAAGIKAILDLIQDQGASGRGQSEQDALILQRTGFRGSNLEGKTPGDLG